MKWIHGSSSVSRITTRIWLDDEVSRELSDFLWDVVHPLWARRTHVERTQYEEGREFITVNPLTRRRILFVVAPSLGKRRAVLQVTYAPGKWFAGYDTLPVCFPENTLADVMLFPYLRLLTLLQEHQRERIRSVLESALPAVTLTSLDITTYTSAAALLLAQEEDIVLHFFLLTYDTATDEATT